MRGEVSEWNDERGFGFIRPDTGGDRVFFHISAFTGRGIRPVAGTVVDYDATVGDKGVKATRVSVRGANRNAPAVSRRGAWRVVVGLAALALVAGLVAVGMLPGVILPLYCGASLLLFLMYALDKRAARRSGRRTPESTLQMVALSGGWPGALIAQHVFRHKSVKASFQRVFWLVVVANGIALWLVSRPAGSAVLRELLGSGAQ